MNKSYLIPLAALTGGLNACGGPDYVGDWNLTKVTLQGDEAVAFQDVEGELRIEKDGAAELQMSWVEKYDGESYSYSLEADGEAIDRGDDVANLELEGTWTDDLGNSKAIELDVDCEAQGDEMTCDGDLKFAGFLVVGIEVELERE